MMIVLMIRGKIIRTVLCCIVYYSCTQSHTLMWVAVTGELGPVGLGSVCVCVCVFFFLARTGLFVIRLFFVLFGCCLVVITSAVDCMKRLKMTRCVLSGSSYVVSGTLICTHSFRLASFYSFLFYVVALWCSVYNVRLAVERSQVRLPAIQ